MTSTSLNGFRATLASFVLASTIGGCGINRDKPAQGTFETGRGAVVASSILPDSFTITSQPYYENTARVAPPSIKFPNGLMTVQTGEPELSSPAGVHLLTRDLYDANGKLNTAGSTSDTPYPPLTDMASPPKTVASPATDNQMVRQWDGTFLAMKVTTFWPDVSPPLPYADVDTGITGHPGARGGHSFVSLADPATGWTVKSLMDFGTFNGGTWGYPRLHPDNTAIGGGSDRQEMYACPFTHNLYLTARMISGPFPVPLIVPVLDGNGHIIQGFELRPSESHRDEVVLFMSQDGGSTWSVVTGAPIYASPLVMTSTPDGRLFLFGVSGTKPLVQFSQPMGIGGIPVLGQSFDASFVDNGQPVAAGRSESALTGFMIVSDQNPALALNADKGARDGGGLKFTSDCSSASNADCAWTYQNGMIVSGQPNPGGPPFALTAVNGAKDNGLLQLTSGCDISKQDCTWTYKQGQFLSDKDPSLALKVNSDGTLTLTKSACSTCTFTLQHVMLGSAANSGLRVNAYGGAREAGPVKLTGPCVPGSGDCTWTFKNGLIFSDSNPALAVKPANGTVDGHSIVLASGCSPSDLNCSWKWSHGELISLASGATPLAINAFGGAGPDPGPLQLNGTCTAANANCVFNGLPKYPAVNAPTLAFTSYMSRVSTDATTSKVRVVYSSLNASQMQEARIVNVDANDPTHPVPVKTITSDKPDTHSIMFTTFIDPDYIDMPGFIKSNTSVLYWEDVPNGTTADQTYSARYALVRGDSDVGPALPLSVANGMPHPWKVRANIGDYVTGGFFWSGKTLNYLAQWVEPTGIQANVVTVNSPAPGFMITSDVNASLAVNAFGGTATREIKLHNQCTSSNPDCTWSYQRGMIVSDADPTLAISAAQNPMAGDTLTLAKGCSRDNPSCTWTYSGGRFLSDRNTSLAIRAPGAQLGTALKLSSTSMCGSSAECMWTLPHVLIMIDSSSKLALNAYGGAVDGNPVSLHNACDVTNANCTWTLSGGLIKSDGNSAVHVRATRGAQNQAPINLSAGCDSTFRDCKWTWKKGELINDLSNNLPINAYNGPSVGGVLVLNSECTASNRDCLFSGLFGP
jgi:hypothetical protein